MTPDGISTEDWKRVQELATRLANATEANDEVLHEASRQELLGWLRQLHSKYGELPSILATEADYVEETAERLALLTRAYELAEPRADSRNLMLIASSIAQIYIEELGNYTQGKYWIAVFGRRLAQYPDEFEQTEFNRLNELLRSKASGSS